MKPFRVKDDAELRRLALRSGASVRVDNKVINASGQKIAAAPRSKPADPPESPAPKAAEPPKVDDGMREQMAVLNESVLALTRIVETQARDIADLRETIAKDREARKAKPMPVVFDIVRNADGLAMRMVAKPADAAGPARGTH